MNQCDRIRLILRENHMKQKQLAAELGVTESYISKLLKDPSIHLSHTLTALIEEKLGYRADWLVNGDLPKRSWPEGGLTELHRKTLAKLEKMDDRQVKAVLAFINSLDDIEKSFTERGQGEPQLAEGPNTQDAEAT